MVEDMVADIVAGILGVYRGFGKAAALEGLSVRRAESEDTKAFYSPERLVVHGIASCGYNRMSLARPAPYLRE